MHTLTCRHFRQTLLFVGLVVPLISWGQSSSPMSAATQGDAPAPEAAHDHPHDHNDDPLLTQVIVDHLEWRDTANGSSQGLSAEAWVGKDINKLWLKTHLQQSDGAIEDAEVQALFSHAIAPYWDLQTGLRQDTKPSPSRTWGVLGVKGLAPHFFDVDAALFIGDSGQAAARVSAEYDMLVTQRLILSPGIEINFYTQDDAATGTGSGLSSSEMGLRLRYEICREFAPYLGVNWHKTYGQTARFAREEGEVENETVWVAGMRFWF